MYAEDIARLLEYFNLRQFLIDNSPLRLALIAIIMGLMFIVAKFLCKFIQNRLERYVEKKIRKDTNSAGDLKSALGGMDFDIFEHVIKNSRRLLYFCILYWGFSRLVIGPVYTEFVKILFAVLFIWAIITFFTAFVPFNIDLYLRRRGSTLKTSQSRSLMPIIKSIIWAIGLTFLLDNLGFHVSTIIAGLGIVGVAVGLAGQAILADFFSYIVILLDKPFRIGDYVDLGNGHAGDVEYMGPKTTHLRDLQDNLIVCANSEMTKGILVNLGSIHERQVIMELGVSYDTPTILLKKMPDILREVVNSFQQCSFDRACLLEFGSSNLIFQLLYMVSEQRGGIRDFLQTRSDVNIAILDRFNKEGIVMDFPTETVLFSDPVKSAAEKIQNAQAAAQTGQTEAKPEKEAMRQESGK